MPITGSGEGLLAVCGGTGQSPSLFLSACYFLLSIHLQQVRVCSPVCAMVYAALVLRREPWLPPPTAASSGSTMELFAPSGLEQPSVDSQDCRGHSGGWSAAAAHVTRWPLMGSFERGGGCWGARAGHTTWQAEAVICVIYSGWGWPAREGSVGL